MPKLAQFDEDSPIITVQPVSSGAEGLENVSKAFGLIGDTAMKQAKALGEEASSSNLMSAHSSLQELSNQTQIDMERDQGNAANYAKKARDAANTITQNSYVNDKDRKQLNYLSNNLMSDLNLKGTKKELEVNKTTAKYQGLNDFNKNLQSIHDTLYLDPKSAHILIDGQLKAIDGNVRSGIYTVIEGSNLKKKIEDEITRAHQRGISFQSGEAESKHINALNSYQPNPVPYSNAGTPMDANTQHLATLHHDDLNKQDMESTITSGNYLSAFDMRNIKSDDEYNTMRNYQTGAMMADGMINSGQSWDHIKAEAKKSNSIVVPNSTQKGYSKRLDYFINLMEKQGGYAQIIDGTPDGASAFQDYQKKQAAIDKGSYHGTDQEASQQKSMASSKNINEWLRKRNAIGIGMDIPDQYRNYIPPSIAEPVADSFLEGRDFQPAINNIAMLDKDNMVTLSKQMPTMRKRLTVYDTGMSLGLVDKGFFKELWQSQQDGLDFKDLNPQNSNDQRLTDNQIRDKFRASSEFLAIQNNYMNYPKGAQLVEASMDKSVRYAKYMGYANKDYKLSNIGSYVDRYTDNTAKAYSLISSLNYSLDTKIIPVNEPQASALSSYALNETYKAMRGYMSDTQLSEYVSKNNPHLINLPNGRLVVVDRYNQAIPNKEGKPAFQDFYSSRIQSIANGQVEKRQELRQHLLSSPFMQKFPPMNIGGMSEPTVEEAPLPTPPKQASQKEHELVESIPNKYANVTQKQIDRAKALPAHITKGNFKEYHEALKPFMNPDKHDNISEADLQKELDELRTGNFTKGKRK